MGQLDRQKTGIFLHQRDSKEKTNKQTAGGVSDIVISDSMWDGQTCFVLTVLCLQCLISLGQTHKGLTTWIVSVVCCTLTRTLNETSANISQDDCFILARLFFFFFKHLSTDKNGCQLIDPPPPSPQFTHTVAQKFLEGDLVLSPQSKQMVVYICSFSGLGAFLFALMQDHLEA